MSIARVISQDSDIPLSSKMLGMLIISCFDSFLKLCSSEAVPSVFRLTTFASLRSIAISVSMSNDGVRKMAKPMKNFLCVALYVLCSIINWGRAIHRWQSYRPNAINYVHVSASFSRASFCSAFVFGL